eukprot:1153933-Pelagomonas_calceolata.AAC.6
MQERRRQLLERRSQRPAASAASPAMMADAANDAEVGRQATHTAASKECVDPLLGGGELSSSSSVHVPGGGCAWGAPSCAFRILFFSLNFRLKSGAYFIALKRSTRKAGQAVCGLQAMCKDADTKGKKLCS